MVFSIFFFYAFDGHVLFAQTYQASALKLKKLTVQRFDAGPRTHMVVSMLGSVTLTTAAE
jgi:hypothetical protein